MRLDIASFVTRISIDEVLHENSSPYARAVIAAAGPIDRSVGGASRSKRPGRARKPSPKPREVNFRFLIEGELLDALIQNSPVDSQGRPILLSVDIYFLGNLLNSSTEIKYRDSR